MSEEPSVSAASGSLAEQRLRRSLADLRHEVDGLLAKKPEPQDAFESTVKSAFDTIFRLFGFGARKHQGE